MAGEDGCTLRLDEHYNFPFFGGLEFLANKYRSRIEIIADLLSAVQSKSKKTHIMYESNLSYNLLMQYLNLLLKIGLIRKNNDGNYEISGRGRRFLEECRVFLEKKRLIKEYTRTVTEIQGKLEELCSIRY